MVSQVRDITYEVVESEWAESWSNYEPAIVTPKDSSFDLGFREATTQLIEAADELFTNALEKRRFIERLTKMYQSRL